MSPTFLPNAGHTAWHCGFRSLVRVTIEWTRFKSLGQSLLAFAVDRSTVAALLAFIAGVVVTLFASGKLGVILACRFDWTVFWTAVQAIAVSIAGLIALGQLSSYLSTERDKNTVALFQELDKGDIDETIGTLTSSTDTSGNIEEVRQRLSSAAGDRGRGYSLRLQTLANMFDRVALQYQSGVINKRMYLWRMDELTLRVYAVCKAVRGDSFYKYDLTDFENLARECQHNYIKYVKSSNEEYEEYLAKMTI